MSWYPKDGSGVPHMPYNQPMHPGVYASDLEHQSVDGASYTPAFGYNQPMYSEIDSSPGNSVYYNNSTFGAPQYYPTSYNEQVQTPFPSMAASSGYVPGLPLQQVHLQSQNFDVVPQDVMQNTNIPPDSHANLSQIHYQNDYKTRARNKGRGSNNNNRGNRRGGFRHSENFHPVDRNFEFNHNPAQRGNFRGHRGYQAMSFQNRNRRYDYGNGQPSEKNLCAPNDRRQSSRGKQFSHQDCKQEASDSVVKDDSKVANTNDSSENGAASRNKKNAERMPGQSSYSDGKEGRIKQNGNSANKFDSRKTVSDATGGQKDYNSKGARPKYGRKWDPQAEDKDESQRGSLTEQLSRNAYECMVCCEIIKVESAIWSCQNCYHVFHLHCTKKWAHSSVDKDTNSWRCPGCQNESPHIPSQYRCFCGRRKDPAFIRGETPHSCGETCRKKRKGHCKHPCTILCHPGPCPPCSSMVSQPCDCGKQRKSMRCSVATSYKCDTVCNKVLYCGDHYCLNICHASDCEICTVSNSQGCYCGKRERQVYCGTPEFKMISYSCEEICGKTLSCGNHICEVACHPGECASCHSDPSVLTTCCCGKTPLEKLNAIERHSCLDPIPVCENVCNKPMACGPENNHHLCTKPCHEGDCGPCDKETSVHCQCGRMYKDFSCEIAVTFGEKNPFKCQKRCGKKKNCGRHKCSDNCCVKDFHICEYICGLKLSCGFHKCKELCHRGNCKRCLETSFDELTCFCGATVMEPPIPCGTRPPECHQLCTRPQKCGHPIRHNCHIEDDCPPCTELTEKTCMGGHIVRRNIPCHMKNISCGMPCDKQLPCGLHRCQKLCHNGPCLLDGATCTQACTKVRSACGHPCAAPCHEGDCPPTFCKTEIAITCRCGNRSTKTQCQMGGDQSGEIAQFQRLSVQSIAESGGEGVDMAQFSQTKPGSRKLDCDTTCAVLERNKRVALALEIKNPDIGVKLGNPSFTDFLKEFGKKNPIFATGVERSLGKLVLTAKKSPHQNRSHSFPSMNRDQRRFVHELAELYGCQTQSYDFEPNKNVVATAYRDKCWLPNVTLTQLLVKDSAPKAPPPLSSLKTQGVTFTVLEKKKTTSNEQQPPSFRGWQTVPSSKPTSQPSAENKTSAAPTVDYFDFTEN